MTFYIKERIENVSRRKGQVGAETEERKNEWAKCGRTERNLLYAEQYFSIYGKIII